MCCTVEGMPLCTWRECPRVMEGWSVEEAEELNKLTTEPVTMRDTALARHQSLIERQMGNIIKNTSNDKSTSWSESWRMQTTHRIMWVWCLFYDLLKFVRHRTTWRIQKEESTAKCLRQQCRWINLAIRVIKITYHSKKGEFPSRHATTKHVTKLAWWLCEAISKNTTN